MSKIELYKSSDGNSEIKVLLAFTAKDFNSALFPKFCTIKSFKTDI